MPKLKFNASPEEKKDRMADEMRDFKSGKMHSGSKDGPVVTDRKQAIAIGLNVSRLGKRKAARKSGRGGRR